MKHKYKVGDRVVYRIVDDIYSNADLHGRAGRIIGIDQTRTPYTVEFDEPYCDAMEDHRFGGKKGHCWHCTENHLTLEADIPAQPDRLAGFFPYNFENTIKITKGEKEMEYNRSWSPEEDAKLTQLKAEGKKAAEIARIIGRSLSSVNCRWSDMQRSKKTDDAPTVAAPEKQEGELNDLEQAMAEQIKELTAKKEQLETEIKDLCDSLEKACAENKALLEKICTLEEALVQRDAEATDARATVALIEEQLDETKNALREAKEKIANENQDQVDHFRNLLCKRDSKIDALQHELVGVYRTALKLAERCLEYRDHEEIPQI